MSPCTCSASIRQCMWFTCMNYLLICEGYRRVMQQYYSFTNSEYLWILTSSVQVPAFCRCRYCIVWGCVHIKSQHWLPIQIGMVKKLHEIDIGYGVVTPVKFCVGALIAHSIHKWSSEFGFCMLSQPTKSYTHVKERLFTTCFCHMVQVSKEVTQINALGPNASGCATSFETCSIWLP